jgi:thiosulfate reductase cytochrome b subunit
MAVLIGLSIWKPLQLAWLAELFGGYPLARNIHLARCSASSSSWRCIYFS